MNISLTRQLEQYVARQVKTGRYGSASEVVREGLRLLQQRDRSEQSKLEALREAVKAGRASGPATPLDMDRVIAGTQSNLLRPRLARHQSLVLKRKIQDTSDLPRPIA